MIELASKSLFLPQNRKNHPAAGPLCDTLELHRFVQHGTKIRKFLSKKKSFGSSAFSLSRTLVTFVVAFTPADRFFKRLCGPHRKRANKR